MVMIIFLHHHIVASLSPLQQKTALFQFKQSLTISPPTICYYKSYSDIMYISPTHPKTRNWSMSSDYCTWEGVTCDHKTGDVIGLDLSCSQLEGTILPNSTLFQLSHLRFLNLSNNDFTNQDSFLSNEFPREFGFFAKGLTHLNLSFTEISGRVPSGISHLHKLVSLDFSCSYHLVQLDDDVFKSLLQNLTRLRVLNLEGVNISSVLPFNLSTSLRVLNLRYTGLHGVLPQEVFHLPNIEFLALRGENNLESLQVVLPKVKWGSSRTLQHLSLQDINFHHECIPDSIGFLDSLTTLSLSKCNLSGPVPKSIGNLGQLIYLGLERNNLSGPILTLLQNLTNLSYLILHENSFTGPFPSSFASTKFIDINLFRNGLTGPLPPGLFDLPSLEKLDLSHNGLTGEVHVFGSSKPHLKSFDSRNNSLHGSNPQTFSHFVNFTRIDVSSYNFSGVLDFKIFSRIEPLKYLDLSHNSLSVRGTAMSTLPPRLHHLGLSSCKLKEFPHFSRDAEILLEYVDLSNNDIDGEIPYWVGSVSLYLNLSQNMLTGGLEHLPWNNIQYLDLHSNKLNGSLSTLICNSGSLQILSLSNNTLSGVLPICQNNLTSLSVFDLRMNNIEGNIPQTLTNFRNLETINLNGNRFKGRIPSSFAEFDSLQVLDLGNNQINDTFPQCLETLPNLQVLVLKSNKFYGGINKSSEVEHPFPSLRIIDISYNNFSGPLPAIYFKDFKAMMNGKVNKLVRSYMEHQYYSDSTNLVIKGNDILLSRILTVFTTIDVSKNNFEGGIPEYLGSLVSLRFLNLSHNHLTGHIPPSIANLTVLESLDLSSNQLEGEVPPQLTGLYSLALLNLSYNKLRGHIPEGFQFNTFENDSYVGNLGLCGKPLSNKCGHDNVTQEEDEEEDDDYFFGGFTWEAVVIGYGCGVVPAFIAGYWMLLARKPKWFAGIIARELGLKVRRMEIKWR
ncbi:receptor-like protein 7 [Apium graveolens]|uniref:receptor-like protein 7 n=1 Tax=Apium graveolens TaxID=4045 RepID=UPI003D7B0799